MTQLGTMMPNKEREESIPSFEERTLGAYPRNRGG